MSVGIKIFLCLFSKNNIIPRIKNSNNKNLEKLFKFTLIRKKYITIPNNEIIEKNSVSFFRIKTFTVIIIIYGIKNPIAKYFIKLCIEPLPKRFIKLL